FPPLDLMLPDLIAPDVGLVGTLQGTGQSVEVIAVKLGVGERVGLVLDLGVVVDGLLKIEVVLVVVRVVRDELTSHRLRDFLHTGLYRGPQEITGPFGKHRAEQEYAVSQLFRRWP